MRYYNIVLGGGSGGVAGFPSGWSSQAGGQNDPGALDVLIDLYTSVFALPVGQSYVRVYGVSLQQVSQAVYLTGTTIDVYGGMAPGLPLATAQAPEAGLLVHGTIYPGFGNWQGTDQSIDMIVQPPFMGSSPNAKPDSPVNPAPLVHSWPTNQKLSDSIKNTLSTAYPGFTPNINISPNLIWTPKNTDYGFWHTIESYAEYINSISKTILGNSVKNYPGVHMTVKGNEINVSDQTSPTGAKQIQFQDLIGQPTWLGVKTISVKCVMRGDIHVNDQVMLPQTITVSSAASSPQFRSSSAFSGTWWVRSTRHIGRFRQEDGDSWCTVLECVSLQ